MKGFAYNKNDKVLIGKIRGGAGGRVNKENSVYGACYDHMMDDGCSSNTTK